MATSKGERKVSKEEVLSRLRQITGEALIKSKETGADVRPLVAVREIIDKLSLVEEEDRVLAADIMPKRAHAERWTRPSFAVLERLTLPERSAVGGVEPLAFPTAGTVAVAIAVVVAFRPGAATQDELRRGLLDRLNQSERKQLANQLTALRKDPKIVARLLGASAAEVAELTAGQLEATATLISEYRQATS